MFIYFESSEDLDFRDNRSFHRFIECRIVDEIPIDTKSNIQTLFVWFDMDIRGSPLDSRREKLTNLIFWSRCIAHATS
jgi:hypothetical protein